MNNLLFDEPPIVVSPTLAKMLGDLEEAAILQQIHYWTQKNMNIRDGYSWVYNSMKDWWKQLPWFKTEKTLRSKFTSLEKKGLLVTGNYNKAKFDRTKWYRIDYDAFSQMVTAYGKNDLTMSPNLPNASGKNYPTNTIDYTETTTEMIDRQIDGISKITKFTDFWEKNIGSIAPFIQDDFAYEYWDWIDKGVDHDEVIEIFIKALSSAISYGANDKRRYTLGILHNWLNKNILSINAIEGEEKQFKAKKQQRRQNNSYTNAKPAIERDLSNKHYGTDEELEAEFFGEA